MYDSKTRCLIDNPQRKGDLSSRRDLEKYSDGSVDLFFAPREPSQHKQNWVQTLENRHWFADVGSTDRWSRISTRAGKWMIFRLWVGSFNGALTLGCSLTIATVLVPLRAIAQDDAADLAKQTLNPVAALISVPIKYDYNTNIGPSEQGNQSVLTIQPVIPLPVIPFSIGENWNMISRTIIPESTNITSGRALALRTDSVTLKQDRVPKRDSATSPSSSISPPKSPPIPAGSWARGRSFCCPPAATI